jgi:hypothetical protein
MKKLIKYVVAFSVLTFCMSGCVFFEGTVEEESESEQQESKEVANRKFLEDLDKQFESQWSLQERNLANTAINENYLSKVEKEVYYYLNLVRINPALFGKTYASAFTGSIGYSKGYAFDERKESLLLELSQLESLPLLRPDEMLFESADCFATEGGKQGIVGHDRSTTGCMKLNGAECCHYGGCFSGYEIIMALLVDAGEGNAALGHRRILLNSRYNMMGVAIRGHATYKKNVVLDLNHQD